MAQSVRSGSPPQSYPVGHVPRRARPLLYSPTRGVLLKDPILLEQTTQRKTMWMGHDRTNGIPPPLGYIHLQNRSRYIVSPAPGWDPVASGGEPLLPALPSQSTRVFAPAFSLCTHAAK